ncbi:gliding motility-associated C-terminal domain-containing protein [Tenacibaculum insulae]|uniref:T9SS type B sorting domain-containing protein n=1 Tax=Tenacibaculum insulae TaxID=2029677 RepID=UPI003AB886AF
MKSKLFYFLFLFAFSITYAQIPTNGLQGMYEFTNGSLSDAANSNNFTQTGTALTQVNDRLNNTTKAISLNGDYLSRPFFSHNGHLTYSFWVKTNTDTFEYKTIIDDSQKNGGSNNFASTQKGYSIMLYRGKIIADVRMQHRARFNTTQAYSGTTATSGFIADGNWHHIIVRFQARSRSGNFYGVASIHVDGALHEKNDQLYANAGTTPFFDLAGDIVVGNNKNNTIPANLKYNDVIDDILIYDRELTAQEILNIRNVGGYCTPPNNSVISSTTITGTTIALATPATEHEVAYHKSSEPFTNATIITQVFNGTTINGLDPSTPYKFYVRTPCATTGTSAWSAAKTYRTTGIIYVNHAATGNNDGSSWVNAYTDLRSSIFFGNTNSPIWVASGTYKPHTTSRTVYFQINKENVKIYGGFSGTETSISQRIVGVNETILSGDLQGNDTNLTDYALNYANTSRNNDNSYHIINIEATGNNLLLDGLTISDAHTNLDPTERGGAIIKDKTIAKLTLKNCIVKDNVSRNDNAGLLAEFELNNTSGARGELIIENSKFINNMSRWASGIYTFVRANTNVDITVINSLFDNNLAGDLSSSVTGISGSAAWFRVIANGSNVTLNLTNNTYVNNKDIGTNLVNNLSRAVVAISKPSGISSTLNAEVNNTIFWGNTGPSGVTTRSITDLNQTSVNSLIINNSIDELNFNDDSITSTTNTSNSDPLFTSATDFTLQSGSPAKDSGDNGKTEGNTDLLGNNRIFNTTVDMGAYEFGSTVYVERTLTINATNGTVATNPNPNGNGAYADGTSVELTATPDTGYQFDGWSGDASGTTNPLNITMDADKTITAIFSLIPAPTPTFINPPTSISDVFTATIQFDIAVTGFDVSDITVTGATLSNFTAVTGTNYTVDVTPANICGTPVTLQVLEDVAQDSNNVDNVASSLITITTTDNVDPVVVTQDITVQLDANGNATITPSQIDNGSSDNCAITSMSLDVTSFTCADLGINTVRLTVEDTTGNSVNNTATVTVVDSVDPIVITQNLTIQLDVNGNATITPSQVDNGSTDNCSIASMSLDVTDFTCSDLGANTVTLTVTDGAGNSAPATAVVTVVEDPNQTFTARAQDITVQLDADGNATITAAQVNNGSGSGCNGNPTISLDVTDFTCSDLGANTVTLTATDRSSTDTATAVVTVEDNILPTVVTQDITVQLDANGSATITPSQIDNGSSDNCSIASMSLDITDFTCAVSGVNTVTLTVTDTAGNSVDATAEVTVEDVMAPTVVTQNITVQLDVNGDATITPSQVDNGSSDNCGIAFMSLDVTSFTCSDLGVNTVTLTVVDTSTNNSSSATAEVTVTENPSQAFTARAQDITVQLDADGNATITATQVDNGSGSGCTSNPTISLDVTDFTCANLGANIVTLTATDGSSTDTATAVVTVEDVMAPTVLLQDITVQLDGSGNTSIVVADIDNGITDNCSVASMSLDVTDFTCANLGTNAVTLTVVDDQGNSTSNTAVVTVVDVVAPTVLTQDITVQLGAGGQVSITPAQINNGSSDNCTSSVNLTYSLDVTDFSCSNLGANTVTLTVEDENSNEATATAVVTIVEDPNQTLSAVAQDITVQLNANGQITVAPSQVDNGSGSGCNSNPTLSLDVTDFTCANLGANTVTLTATDGTTTETTTAIVTVEDVMGATVVTQDITVTLDANGDATITTTDIDNGTTDNCSIASMSLDVTDFDCSMIGANTVTLTVVDGEGNTASETAIVTVEEDVAPTVVTQNITVQLDALGSVTITPQQIDNGSIDDCSGIASMTLDKETFNCPTLGTTTVILTVTDNNGNTATETAVVTITGPDEDNDGISDACDSKELVFKQGFSPNGDNVNDTWVIENIDNYPKNKVEVFNRWGEKVFAATNYMNDWDGKANQRGGSNEKLPVGSYLYIINLNEPGVSPIKGWLYVNY